MRLPITSAGPAAQVVIIGNMFGDAISDATEVAGCVSDKHDNAQAALYVAGDLEPLNVPGQSDNPESCGFGIASPGLGLQPLTVGSANFPASPSAMPQGVLWNGTGGQRLPNFSGMRGGVAYGVDAAGDLTGQSGSNPSGPVLTATVQLAGGEVLYPFGNSTSDYTTGAGIIQQIDGSVGVVGIDNSQGDSFYYNTATGSLVQFAGEVAGASSMNNLDLAVGATFGNPTVSEVTQITAGKATTTELVGKGAVADSVNNYNIIVGAGGGNVLLWAPKGFNGIGKPEKYGPPENLSSMLPPSWTMHFAFINNHDQIVANGTKTSASESAIFSRYRQAIDVSRYSGAVTKSQMTTLLNTGPYWNLVIENLATGGVCGKTPPPKAPPCPNKYAYDTLEAASEAQMPGAAYVILNFKYPTHSNWSGAQQMKIALGSLCKAGSCIDANTLAFISLDVECGHDCANGGLFGNSAPAQIQQVINDAVKAAPKGVAIAIYAVSSQWNKYLGDWGGKNPQNPYSVCPLWDASPDNVDDLNETTVIQTKKVVGFQPKPLYGGWTTRFSKQYEFNTGPDAEALERYTGINSIDLDTLEWNPWALPPCVGGTPP